MRVSAVNTPPALWDIPLHQLVILVPKFKVCGVCFALHHLHIVQSAAQNCIQGEVFTMPPSLTMLLTISAQGSSGSLPIAITFPHI